MSKAKESPAPAPGNGDAPAQWKIPTADQEFVFENIQSAPGWVDPNWASFDRGPALALPAGDLYGDGPYHTKIARVGDTVRFIAATQSTSPRFEVIEGVPEGADATIKPPQVTSASLEDLLKGGTLAVGDLDPAALAQVESRSPRLIPTLEAE